MKAGIPRLRKRIEDTKAFDPQKITDRFSHPELTQLEASIDEALIRTFGADSLDYERYRRAGKFYRGPIVMGGEIPRHEWMDAITKSKEQTLALLDQAIRSLEEQIAEIGDAPSSNEAPLVTQQLSRKIFIVHGRADGPKEAVARFLQKVGFEPVILHERPNKGRTLIAKFREEAADIGFAIVLMTPDDAGGARDEIQQPRARQNVVFELGFFIGALGPHRVTALIEGEIEKPSDFDGVVYTPMNENWRMALGRELKAAGYPVDWNRVMD